MTVGARLLSVRLQGFKSFAVRTALEFGPGISAVIGPNGAGKSNLADALRWTFGEQGRALRSRRAEDIIFAGSEGRPAVGMADVTVVIDNADGMLPVDYGVVELGRRLFRSGENEYLLNGTRVRLRDLEELLDAAHLADNAFLFIGQGMVDQALALRPEERRPLFDEVAGVRRHERRKRAAQAQLAESEANLARVGDVLAELRPQARRLAAQARQQEARSEAAAALAMAIVAEVRVAWHAAATKLREADLVRSREQAAIDAAIAELRSADDAIVEAGRAVEGHVERTRSARAELDRSRATLADARIEEARATAERESLMRDVDRLDRERQALEERVTAARRRLALPPPVAPTDPEEAPAPATGDAARESDDRRATARQRLETLRRGEAEEDEALTAALEEEREASAALGRARLAADEASARASESRSTVEQDRARIADLTVGRDAAEGAHRAAASAATRAEERLRAVERQLGDAEESAAGSNADAALIRGLRVEARLQAAVEAALGAAVNASVSGTDAVSQRGSTRPLVLRDLAGPSLAQEEGAEALTTAVHEGGGALGDALRSDPSGIGRRILQRALWVPELQAALRVAPHLPAGWLVVTAAGERIDAVGVLEPVPGSSRLALEEERARLAAELRPARAGAERSASVLEAAEAALREARDLLAGHEATWATLEAERRTRMQAQDGAERRAELAGREAAWARVQQERRTTEVARLEAVLGDGSPASARRPENASEWKAFRDAVRERQRLEGEVAANTARSTTVAAERDAVAEALARAEPERVRLAALIAEVEAGVAERVTALAALDVQEASGRERLDAAERVRRMAGERLQAAEGRARGAEIAELEARMSLDAVRERLLVELASLGPVGLAALTASRTTGEPATAISSGTPVMVGEGARGAADETIVSRLEAALTSVEGEWSAAAPAAEPPSPGRVASLRRRYQEVGVENPFAAEEHAEISARLTELETQRDDLLRAIAATRELIADLERLIIDQFQTTFRALETAFERRFGQLFGGGTAKLSLTDPADPAASGVEIVARPPGKKAQALAMLSGGERALTAVALLFAMLEVRPVPFCVLDEVDAALDEANIGRFAAALRDLAATIQFVVITHNRGTIEQADALYGVTIGDDAVSRVISLRLEPGEGDGRAAAHPTTIGVAANGRQAAGSSGNVERVS